MDMFSTSYKPRHGRAQHLNGASEARIVDVRNSVIDAGLEIIGELRCDGDLRIDGAVQGDITSRSVTIGVGARVDGEIVAETVHVAGLVNGNIDAMSVTLAKSAKVVGNVTHNSLSIEAGAVIDGLRPWRPPTGLIRARVGGSS